MSKKIHPYYKKLIDYSNDVVNGKVIACQKHIWVCMRFLSDVDRSKNDPSFEYEFDGDRAEAFSEWCGIFKHTKGVLAGKPVELVPVTHFIFGNIYGWYNKKNGYRRFNRFYWQVARKNAKSQLMSIQSSYELFVFPENEVSEVYCGATKKKQAEIVYNELVSIIESCEELINGEDYTTTNGMLTVISDDFCKGSFMRALSSDDETKGDGLNPQFGLVDEYHASVSSKLLDILDSAMMSRGSPLLGIITTAGYELNNPCYRVEYNLISNIINPDIPTNIESYFVMVNELDSNMSDQPITVNGKTIEPGGLIDDINDPEVWPKSNPILASYEVGRDKIAKRLELAKEAPEKMRDFMTKTMNVWVNERSFGFMNMSKWNNGQVSQEEFFELLAKNTNKVCYVGLDLSAKLDLTSVTFEFVGDDDRYYIFSHSFMPSEMFHKKIKTDKVPYDLWESKGWLTVTEGGVVDYRAVKKWLMDTCEDNEWTIEEVCIDPHGATQLSSDFIEGGVEVVEIRQGMLTLSEPTKDVRYMAYSDRLVFAENHLLSWAMGNCVTRSIHNGSIMLDKAKAKQRIDPAAALVNAHTRAMCVEVESQNRVMFI